MKIKKYCRIFAALLTVVVLMVSSVTAFAHSGRTDSRGGHKDNKNKSGLGSYHYHCGGHPAHLHNGGVCPYKSSGSKSSGSKSSSKKPAATKKPTATKKPSPTATPVPMKNVDGIEVPAYDYPVAKGQKHAAVKDVQKALIDMGYLDDVADGIYGNKTEAAIVAYCEAYNVEIETINLLATKETELLLPLEYDGYIDEILYVQIMKDYIEYLDEAA